MTEQTEWVVGDKTYDAPEPETELMVSCLDCGAISSYDDVDRVYECNNCGNHGFGIDERRCEDCNRFMTKVTDEGCPECQEGETQEVTAVLDEDSGEYIEFSDWEAEHSVNPLAAGEPRLLSKRQKAEADQEAIRTRDARVVAWLEENAHRTVAEEVPEGSYLVERGRNGVLYAAWSKVASLNVQTETRMATFGGGKEGNYEREVPPNVTLWAGGMGSNYPLHEEVMYLTEEQHQEVGLL